jgi:hypothetical protein
MEYAARVALGVAGGYFLGRTRKMRLALMLASTAAGRKAGGPAALLGQGKKIVDASPELSRLVDEVRGRLLQSGKGVALAVAAQQVESLTDRLAGRVESSLSNVADRGRPSTNSLQANEDIDEVADEHPAEEAEERSAPQGGEDEQDEPTSIPEDDSHTNAAAVQARRSKGATRTATSGTRTAARRSADKARPTGQGSGKERE